MNYKITLALITSVAISNQTMAHITFVDAKPLQVGKSFKVTLAVPHGCEGSTTQSIFVQIPKGVINVKAMPKANWRLNYNNGKYDKSYQLYGNIITNGVKDITWKGNLPDTQYDEFTFTGYLAENIGDILYFPVTQKCVKGQLLWTDTSGKEIHGHDAQELEAPHLPISTTK